MNRPLPHFCPQCGAPLTNRERFGRPRPVCTVCDHTVFIDPKVAVAVLLTRDDEVLLVRRSNDPGRGKWALPAGFIDPDEDPRAAAVRELEEETGLEAEITGLIGLFHRPDPDGLADLVIAYSALPVGGRLRAGDDASAAHWFSASALDSMPIALTTTERLLVWWRERLEPDL
ncbi:MAG TPA: NUDIX hydrolase [Candidatus Limnocylindrales bacterium]|nr:NUDIX hydrolase [Candidatus Limnocylindrales bacterium]